jgi:hypothetical protein
MMSTVTSRARAVADLSEGLILATVEIAAPPERVFRALASEEICQWWVRPGVFDTREWTGDVRVGGRWRASGCRGDSPTPLKASFLRSIRRAGWCTRGSAQERLVRRRPCPTCLSRSKAEPASRFGIPASAYPQSAKSPASPGRRASSASPRCSLRSVWQASDRGAERFDQRAGGLIRLPTMLP